MRLTKCMPFFPSGIRASDQTNAQHQFRLWLPLIVSTELRFSNAQKGCEHPNRPEAECSGWAGVAPSFVIWICCQRFTWAHWLMEAPFSPQKGWSDGKKDRQSTYTAIISTRHFQPFMRTSEKPWQQPKNDYHLRPQRKLKEIHWERSFTTP
jgi:hypothetical protein